MKITSRGRYAVLAMVDLAKFGSQKPCSLSHVSIRQNISLSYLEQIFNDLKKAELVKSQKGPGGGNILNKQTKEIKISYIISAVDEEVKTLKCKRDSKKGCNGKNTKCITHNLWDDLEKHINSFFDKVNLDDLVDKKIKY